MYFVWCGLHFDIYWVHWTLDIYPYIHILIHCTNEQRNEHNPRTDERCVIAISLKHLATLDRFLKTSMVRFGLNVQQKPFLLLFVCLVILSKCYLVFDFHVDHITQNDSMCCIHLMIACRSHDFVPPFSSTHLFLLQYVSNGSSTNGYSMLV